MAMPAWIPEAWNRLNEDNQKQIADYMECRDGTEE